MNKKFFDHEKKRERGVFKRSSVAVQCVDLVQPFSMHHARRVISPIMLDFLESVGVVDSLEVVNFSSRKSCTLTFLLIFCRSIA